MFFLLWLSMAFLSNTSQFDTSKIKLVNIIRDIFITKIDEPAPKKEEAKMNVSEILMNAYAGWYINDRDGAGAKIDPKDNDLLMNGAILTPQSENKFKMAAPIRLVEINDSKELLYIIPDRDTIHYLKAETPIVTNEYLEKFVGEYFSTETNSTITVYLKKGKLMINLKPNTDYQLNPTYKDAFNIADFGGNLYFVKNRMVTMKVSTSRARNIEFKKLK